MTKYNLLTDQELWESVKFGNRSAYAAIYERYFSVLYLHARNRLRDAQEAEDLVQELFLDLWNSSSTISIKTSLSNYLYACVRNRVLNLLSHKNIQEKYISSLSTKTKFESITDHLVRERLLSSLIEKEIAQLPPRMKEVFLLSRRSNMTYVQIAGQLDITEQSVRSHVKNALKVLRVKLGILLYIFLFFYS